MYTTLELKKSDHLVAFLFYKRIGFTVFVVEIHLIFVS